MEPSAANGPLIHPSDDTRVYVERRWNDTDKGKLNDSERNLSHCHSAQYRSHVNIALGANPSFGGEKSATNLLGYGTAQNFP
jgi:hypothetical protein